MVKRMWNGFDLVGDGLQLVIARKKLTAMMGIIVFAGTFIASNFAYFLVSARAAGIKSTWFGSPTLLAQLKPYLLPLPDRVAALVIFALAIVAILLGMIFCTAYSWLVRDALSGRKNLDITGRIKDSASRVFAFPWLILFLLASLILNISGILMFIFPMLTDKRHDIAKLFGRSVELFFSHIPELIGAGLASLAYFVFGAILVGVPAGLLTLVTAYGIGVQLQAAVSAGVSIIGLLLFLVLMAAVYTVPVALYKKAK